MIITVSKKKEKENKMVIVLYPNEQWNICQKYNEGNNIVVWIAWYFYSITFLLYFLKLTKITTCVGLHTRERERVVVGVGHNIMSSLVCMHIFVQCSKFQCFHSNMRKGVQFTEFYYKVFRIIKFPLSIHIKVWWL